MESRTKKHNRNDSELSSAFTCRNEVTKELLISSVVFDHDSFLAPFRLDFKTSFTLRTFHHHVSKQFAFERVEISYFDRRNLIARNEKPKQQKKLQIFSCNSANLLNLILPTREKLHNCTVWILLTVCRFFWVRSCKIKELFDEKFPLSGCTHTDIGSAMA